MEREKIISIGTKVFLSLILFLIALLLSMYIEVPLEAVVDLENLTDPFVWLSLAILSTLALLSAYTASRIDNPKIRAVFLFILVIMLIALSGYDELDTLILFSIALSPLAVSLDPKKMWDVWHGVRSIRSLSSIIFLVLVLSLILPRTSYYNDILLEKSLEIANNVIPSGENLEKIVDKLVPPYLTQKDITYINSYLSSLPEWNYLSEEEKNILIERMKKAVLEQKNVLRNVIIESFKESNVKLDKETLVNILGSDPTLQRALDFLFLLLVMLSLAVFSISTEVASIAAFLVLLPLEWWRIRKLQKEENPCEKQ